MTIGNLYKLGYTTTGASFILETLQAPLATWLVDVRMHSRLRRYQEWRVQALEQMEVVV